MSKNFEEEYKNSMEAAAPDLWDRISAKVDAYEAERANQQAVMTENVVSFTTAAPKKKNSFFKRYGGLVVAAAVLVVAIPAVILAKNAGGRKSMTADVMGAAPMYTESVAASEDCMVEESMDADYSKNDAVLETNGNGVYGEKDTFAGVTGDSADGIYDVCEAMTEESMSTSCEEEATEAADSVCEIEFTVLSVEAEVITIMVEGIEEDGRALVSEGEELTAILDTVSETVEEGKYYHAIFLYSNGEWYLEALTK